MGTYDIDLSKDRPVRKRIHWFHKWTNWYMADTTPDPGHCLAKQLKHCLVCGKVVRRYVSI